MSNASSPIPKPVVLGDSYNPPESVLTSKKQRKHPTYKILPKEAVFDTGGIRMGFSDLEYDLVEISKAKMTESYVMRSYLKHMNTILKGGFSITGRNKEAVEYIHHRLAEFGINTSTSFTQIVRSLLGSLILYCNAFVVLRRDKDRSSGRSITINRKYLDPIAGLFTTNPTVMKVKKNDHGVPVAWQAYTGGMESNTFDKWEILHFTYNREDGFVSGTPWIVPVLDDIRAWRRMEELVEIVCNQHAFPLFHYKVGTESAPAEEYDDGTSEVDSQKYAIENAPLEGCLVTSERHEIVAIDMKSASVDLAPYLEYWENRSISGLGLSKIDLGRGDDANRATAHQISKTLADFCTDLQNTFAEQIGTKLFNVLLLEGGFGLNEYNSVKLVFPVIDKEEQLNWEKHVQYMYSNNMITRSEAREMLGREPITKEMEKDMFMHQISMPLELTGATESTSAATKSQKTANKNENVNRPANQYKKLAAKTTPVRDRCTRVLRDSVSTDLDLVKRQELSIKGLLINARKSLEPMVTSGIRKGLKAATKQTGKVYFVGKVMHRQYFNECLLPELKRLVERADRIGGEDSIRRASSFSIAKEKVEDLIDAVPSTAEVLGFRCAARLEGFQSVRWNAKECEECSDSICNDRPVMNYGWDELVPPCSCITGQTIENGS